MKRDKTAVVVIGAGMGGLAAAIRLAAQGCAVTLVETAATPGGKMRCLPTAVGPVDAGPTVLTMRGVFDDLFSLAGERLEDHLTLLPQPVLAAVVLSAVVGLFKVKELHHLWRAHRGEFFVAMAALLGVLGAGLLRGVLIGAVISLVLLIRRAAVPSVAFLGRIPGTRRYSDMARHPSNEPIPGVLAFRPESGLVYFNADHILDTVLARVDASRERPGLVVGDLSNAPYVDMAGARMLLGLGAELERRGVAMRLVDARSSVREMLRAEGVEAKFGRLDRSMTLADVIDDFQRQGGGGSAGSAREAAGPPDRIPGGTPAPATADDQAGGAPAGGPKS